MFPDSLTNTIIVHISKKKKLPSGKEFQSKTLLVLDLIGSQTSHYKDSSGSFSNSTLKQGLICYLEHYHDMVKQSDFFLNFKINNQNMPCKAVFPESNIRKNHWFSPKLEKKF